MLPGQRVAPMPQTENTSAAVGGCAKVTHFLVGLIRKSSFKVDMKIRDEDKWPSG